MPAYNQTDFRRKPTFEEATSFLRRRGAAECRAWSRRGIGVVRDAVRRLSKPQAARPFTVVPPPQAASARGLPRVTCRFVPFVLPL